MTGWEDLSNAIIEQAVKDYRYALKALRRNPDSAKAKATVKEVEKFFHSRWYGRLTEIDPDYLLGRLRKEAASNDR